MVSFDKEIEKLSDNIEKVIIGKPEVVKMALVALLAQGHLLIEDVPGVGKTMLAQSLSRSIDCSFRRIQFTPDLLPSDILGVSMYEPVGGTFDFKHGPIFANIVLVDEINRATPRTQSSLLEAMNDFQVSVDGKTYPLPRPFMVVATQNPLEYHGTYPLPESQLDRFLMRLTIGYPGLEDEKRVIESQRTIHPIKSLQPVVSGESILTLQEKVKQVRMHDRLVDYMLSIIGATRESPELLVGVSPRGTVSLFRAAQARAVVEGRDYCVPDDVKELCLPVLSHRLITRDSVGRERGSQIMEEILGKVSVPL